VSIAATAALIPCSHRPRINTGSVVIRSGFTLIPSSFRSGVILVSRRRGRELGADATPGRPLWQAYASLRAGGYAGGPLRYAFRNATTFHSCPELEVVAQGSAYKCLPKGPTNGKISDLGRSLPLAPVNNFLGSQGFPVSGSGDTASMADSVPFAMASCVPLGFQCPIRQTSRIDRRILGLQPYRQTRAKLDVEAERLRPLEQARNDARRPRAKLVHEASSHVAQCAECRAYFLRA